MLAAAAWRVCHDEKRCGTNRQSPISFLADIGRAAAKGAGGVVLHIAIALGLVISGALIAGLGIGIGWSWVFWAGAILSVCGVLWGAAVFLIGTDGLL